MHLVSGAYKTENFMIFLQLIQRGCVHLVSKEGFTAPCKMFCCAIFVTCVIIIIPGVFSCSSEPTRNMYIEIPISVFSSNILEDEKVNRPERRPFLPTPRYVNSSDPCQTLLPGAESIIHGINIFYFGMNSSDAAPTTSPWTVLSCPSGTVKIDRGYDKPIQFESQVIKTSHVYQEKVRGADYLSRELKMFIPEIYRIGLLTMHFGGPEAYQLATFTTSGSKKTTVTYHMQEYRVKLYGGLIPTKHFEEFWSSLNVPYGTSQEEYHRFIQEFGTHMFIEATFGGRLFLSVTRSSVLDVIRMNDNTPVPPGSYPMEILMRSNPHFRENITERVYVSQGGVFRTDRTIGEWADSVARSPSITRGTKISLSELIPGPDKRKHAFMEAANAESLHHSLRRSLTVIDVVQPPSDLKKFVMKQGFKELKYITPRETFVALIQDIADLPEDFSKYIIQCKRELVKWEDDVRYYEDQFFYNIPVMLNTCTSISSIPHKIIHVEWNLPPQSGKPSCVIVYKGTACNGQETKISSAGDLKPYINSIRSLRLC